MREETRVWLEEAEAELATAKSNLRQGIYYASVLFSQRANEGLIDACSDLAPEYILTRYRTATSVRRPRDTRRAALRGV